MILRQFLHTDPIGISYLFGCGGKAAGAVVDPVGDIQFYLRAAETAGMRIHFVIDTHVHADHQGVAGENEPRLVSPRPVAHQETDMLRRVAGRVQHRRHDVAKRENLFVAHAFERERNIRLL